MVAHLDRRWHERSRRAAVNGNLTDGEKGAQVGLKYALEVCARSLSYLTSKAVLQSRASRSGTADRRGMALRGFLDATDVTGLVE